MMHSAIRYTLLVFLMLGMSKPSSAQDSTAVQNDSIPDTFLYNTDHFVYTDLRYGYTHLGHHFHGGIVYKYRFNIFKIGYGQTNNFDKNPDNNNHIQETSFIYCWSFRKKNFLFSTGFGIGGIWGNAVTNKRKLDSIPLEFDPQIRFKTIGFPFEINFAFTPPPKLKTFSSIGLSFFGNFNDKKTYVGVGLNLSLGKVSPKMTEQQINNPLNDYYVPKQRKQKWYD